VTVYLLQKGKNIWITMIPMVFVLVMTIWAMMENMFAFWEARDFVLVALSVIILGLTSWLLLSSVVSLFRREYRLT
jgi:carbon starvation protein